MTTMVQYHPWKLEKVKKNEARMVSHRPNARIFEKIEEGVEFAKAVNNQIPGVKVVNILYLLILITGRMEK